MSAVLLLVTVLGTVAVASAEPAASRIGAPQRGVHELLPPCDPTIFAPAGDVEGACRGGNIRIVTANRDHTVALKALTVRVLGITPITRIKIGSGSIGPLDPAANEWVAVNVQVKNTSGQAAQLRDEQLNLRLGTTLYPPQPEATSSQPDSLTKPNRKLDGHRTVTGSVVFEIPVPNTALLTAAPTALLFTGFKGDFSFNEFPDQTIGAVRLYK